MFAWIVQFRFWCGGMLHLLPGLLLCKNIRFTLSNGGCSCLLIRRLLREPSRAPAALLASPLRSDPMLGATASPEAVALLHVSNSVETVVRRLARRSTSFVHDSIISSRKHGPNRVCQEA